MSVRGGRGGAAAAGGGGCESLGRDASDGIVVVVVVVVVVVEIELELELEDGEGVGAPIAAAVAENIVKRSCCREGGWKRLGISAARECNRAVAPPRPLLLDDATDDDDDDGFRGVAGRGLGLGKEPIALERTGAVDQTLRTVLWSNARDSIQGPGASRLKQRRELFFVSFFRVS